MQAKPTYRISQEWKFVKCGLFFFVKCAAGKTGVFPTDDMR